MWRRTTTSYSEADKWWLSHAASGEGVLTEEIDWGEIEGGLVICGGGKVAEVWSNVWIDKLMW